MSILQQELRKIVLRLKGKARPSAILTVSDQNTSKKPFVSNFVLINKLKIFVFYEKFFLYDH